MAKGLLRVGIVGASSLMGKELAEELAGSGLGVVDVVLLDEDVEGAQVTAVRDEASFIQQIAAGSFDGMDLCFFAGSTESTGRHWRMAVGAGAGVIDLSHALPKETGVAVRAPWVNGKEPLGLGTSAVTPVHPVAEMLGLVAVRCARLGLKAVAATALEPASERGATGMDEMHRQTVSLLSFQSVPRAEFDAQVAFNLVPQLGAEARLSLESVGRRIEEGYAVTGASAELSLQMVHAPVFHGYAVSTLLDFAGEVHVQAVEAALTGDHVDVVSAGEEAPSNLNATGQEKILVRVREGGVSRVWVWMTADNLKMRASQAIACAQELLALRLMGKMQ